jgi:hypothetical protein
VEHVSEASTWVRRWAPHTAKSSPIGGVTAVPLCSRTFGRLLRLCCFLLIAITSWPLITLYLCRKVIIVGETDRDGLVLQE